MGKQDRIFSFYLSLILSSCTIKFHVMLQDGVTGLAILSTDIIIWWSLSRPRNKRVLIICSTDAIRYCSPYIKMYNESNTYTRRFWAHKSWYWLCWISLAFLGEKSLSTVTFSVVRWYIIQAHTPMFLQLSNLLSYPQNFIFVEK